MDKKIINVLTIGMDSRKQATFRMAFKKNSSPNYSLIENASSITPDVAILDMDCVDSQQLWQNFRANYPNLPCIITSFALIPGIEAPTLTKPIQTEKLFALLQQVLTKTNTVISEPVKQIKTSNQVLQKPPSNVNKSPPVQIESTLIATLKKITPPNENLNSEQAIKHLYQLPENIEHFDPKQGLLGLLINSQSQKIPCIINIANHSIIVLPEEDYVFASCEIEKLRELSQNPDQIITSRQLTPADQIDKNNAQLLSSLLWQMALWMARGRLINNIDSTTQIRIRHWPNLTRLAPINNSLRIAAFLVRSPTNLRILVKMLNIPPEDIFNFIAASYSIGILKIVSAETTNPLVKEKRIEQDKKDKGGFLSRLLRKIINL